MGVQVHVYDVVLHNREIWAVTAVGSFQGMTFDPSVRDVRPAESQGPFYMLTKVGGPETMLVDNPFIGRAVLCGRAQHQEQLCWCTECGEIDEDRILSRCATCDSELG
jgi:hypothetical protein